MGVLVLCLWVEKGRKGKPQDDSCAAKGCKDLEEQFPGKTTKTKRDVQNVSHNEELERIGNMTKKNNARKTKTGNQKF